MVIDSILDTGIIIDLLRNDHRATSWYNRIQNQHIAITPIVWMEAVQGATDKIKRAQIIRFLRQFPIEHPTNADNHWAMRQIARFSLSHSVHLSDAMIASVAVRLAVPLYTLNIKHYAPLPGINIIRPY